MQIELMNKVWHACNSEKFTELRYWQSLQLNIVNFGKVWHVYTYIS